MNSLAMTYTQLPKCMFTEMPFPELSTSKIVALNNSLAEELDLICPSSKEIIQYLKESCDYAPIAQAYSGHQFGHYTVLGDGRALLLGETLNTITNQPVDIHLKGSGRTPYSRRGDGKAALGPMLREYLISESMHALNIPTSRSLAVILTGETVLREYAHPGAILIRVAASHIRVGTFEFAASQGTETLTALFNFSMKRHYGPVIDQVSEKERALFFLNDLIKKQALLITEWERVGFVHGVMNTDNTMISCQTMDYGPCAFMDTYHPETVFSSIDEYGRYAFHNQPNIAKWNLAVLADCLLPLIDTCKKTAIEKVRPVIESFDAHYQTAWSAMMQKKLGLDTNDFPLEDILILMSDYKLDYTNTFFDLTYQPEKIKNHPVEAMRAWYQKWQQHKKENPNAQAMMKTNNPVLIPRNHRVEQALFEAEEYGDLSSFHQLYDALQSPYCMKDEVKFYQKPPKKEEMIYQTFCGT